MPLPPPSPLNLPKTVTGRLPLFVSSQSQSPPGPGAATSRGAKSPGFVARVLRLAAASDLRAGASAGTVSARFHRGLARATADACAQVAAERGLDAVVLSGGVFQNRLLLEATAGRVEAAGLRVLVPERLPAGDGGIAYGQAAVGAAVGQATVAGAS